MFRFARGDAALQLGCVAHVLRTLVHNPMYLRAEMPEDAHSAARTFGKRISAQLLFANVFVASDLGGAG